MEHYGETCDAVARIEWGGMYDTRALELIEYEGKFHYEDLTGGHMTIHDYVPETESAESAKQALMLFCFSLGEPATFIDFGDDGVERKRDYDVVNYVRLTKLS